MPPATIQVNLRSSVSTGEPLLATASSLIGVVGGDYGHSTSLRTSVIPTDEAFYWTPGWQRDEIETLASLAMDQGRRFASAEEMIAWLRSEDDD